jgi:hypothetical protein
MSTLLPDLERELMRAAKREARARRRERRRSFAPRGLAIALIALVVGTTGALAAAGLLFGGKDPVVVRVPEQDGPIVPSGTRLLPIQVPDPDGGQPWGMRIFTTAGVDAGGTEREGKKTCLQVGRLYKGQLGVLGTDGAFGNDGRFHPSAPSDQDCQPQDANGFANIGAGGFEPRPASGYLGRGSCIDARYRDSRRPTCADGRWRTIMGGLAGPEAESVTLHTKDGPLTKRVSPHDQGAYLFVLAGDPADTIVGAAPYVTITYTDGTVCPRDGFDRCRIPPGFAGPKAPTPTGSIPPDIARKYAPRSQDGD